MYDVKMFDVNRLVEAMRYQGRRNQWLAQKTNYSEEYVSRVLAGKNPLTEPFIVSAAQALDIPLHFFLAPVSETLVAA